MLHSVETGNNKFIKLIKIIKIDTRKIIVHIFNVQGIQDSSVSLTTAPIAMIYLYCRTPFNNVRVISCAAGTLLARGPATFKT